jgi:hypothetical protein
LVLRATKEFSKAFIQEKPFTSAIQSLSNIVNLANLALEEGDEMAVEILGFVLVNTKI